MLQLELLRLQVNVDIDWDVFHPPMHEHKCCSSCR